MHRPEPSVKPDGHGTADRYREAYARSHRWRDGAQEITPTDVRVQSSVWHVQSTDHNGIMTEDAWYVFVTIEATGDRPQPTEFQLRTADGEYEPLAADGDYRRHQIEYVEGEAYQPDERTDG